MATTLIPGASGPDGDTMWVLDSGGQKGLRLCADRRDHFRGPRHGAGIRPGRWPTPIRWASGPTGTRYGCRTRTDGKIYAYYLPLEPEPTGVSAKSTGRETATATVEVDNPGSARLTVNLRYKLTTETNWTNATAQATAGISVTFDLTGLTPNANYDLEASPDSNFASGVVSGAFTNRPAGDDYNSLHGDNHDFSSGIWADANGTLYVGQYNENDGALGKIIEYNRLRPEAHALTTTLSDITGLAGADQGNRRKPLWSDGTHLWMTCRSMATAGGHTPCRTTPMYLGTELLTRYPSSGTYGIWGNDSTIWVLSNLV